MVFINFVVLLGIGFDEELVVFGVGREFVLMKIVNGKVDYFFRFKN